MADWFLTPCPGHRTPELLRLLGDLQHPAAQVCVVTTEPDPVRREDIAGMAEHLVHLGDEFNYGKWLNAGIDHIVGTDASARYVFITGSDTRCNASTLAAFIQGAVAYQLVMCGPDHWNLGSGAFDPNRPRGLYYRVPPEYFLLDLRIGIRFDEQFRWWYSDDDLEMQARQEGQVGLVAGVYVEQPATGHDLSPQLVDWVREDRIKFFRKWGHEPW